MKIENFYDKMKTGRKFIVKLGASWCNPCKAMDLEIAKAITQDPIIENRVFRVDIEKDPDFAIEFNVMSVPTTLFVSNGKYELRKGVIRSEEIVKFLG